MQYFLSIKTSFIKQTPLYNYKSVNKMMGNNLRFDKKINHKSISAFNVS